MTRTRIWIAAGVGLAAVLATGWMVVAQPPSTPVNPPAPVPPVGVPVPPSPPGWQLQQAANFQPPPPTVAPVIPPNHLPPTPTQMVPPPKGNGDLVQELIQIINETRSVDTFFVTTKLLEDMGGKSRVAVPAIIRNAERLELFKDAFLQTEKDGDKQKKIELASLIVDSLGKIMGGAQGGNTTRPPIAPATPPATKREADPLLTPTSGRLNRPPVVDVIPPAGALSSPKG